MSFLAEEVQAKWKPILEHEDMAPIKDSHRRQVTAVVLENTERALRESGAHSNFMISETSSPIPTNFMGASSSTAGTGGIDTFDPILISLVRRAMPNLLAYDLCGVQPMTGPTGLIFALRSKYTNQAGTEAFYNEANTLFSTAGVAVANVLGQGAIGNSHVGSLPGVSNNAGNSTYNFGAAMTRAQAEALGTDSNTAWPEMSFEIDKVMVEARSRALQATYTMEMAQDLKAVHGLDAETELSNILSGEILAEINREVIRTINITAKPGAQDNTTTPGIFDLDVDSNGRWSVEKFKGLMFQLEREANQIAKQTRRGKGNIVICSSDVASALQMAGILDYTPALSKNDSISVDDTGSTFAGVLNGKLKVYIDPYSSGGQYLTVGYKGANKFDAGLFYCPYVPLQMVRAVDQMSYAPKIGFKTRYGMVENPFAKGAPSGRLDGVLQQDTNVYYRRVLVNNLM